MYTSFYEFSAKPFNVTPDPRFLYLTSSHRESLASMIYGIKERKGFISITGEVGTGKTTLIYSLLTNLDEKVKAVFIFHTDITFEQLLKNILLELGLPVLEDGKTYLLRTLNGYLIESFSRDENLAVIIDEAQNLPKNVLEELRMLSNLETPRSKLLQMVLVGQPEFEVKLNSEDLRQLKQRIGIRRQIMPLSLRESQEYIDHRLHIAGSKSSNIFTDEAVSLICNYAKGIPRTINALCDNALLIGYSLSKKRIDGDIIHEVIRDMEGSVRDNPAPVEPVAANLFKPSPFKSSTFYKMTSFFIIFLLCILLGVVLGREYFQENSNRIEDSKTTQNTSNRTEDSKSKQNTSADVSQITSKGEVKFKRSVTVEKNDSLSSLGWKYYGTMNETLVDLILDSNPQIKNIHLINVDQQIILPEITQESLIIPSMDHTFEIHLGTFVDTQSAQKYENEPALMGKEIEIIPREVSPVDTWYRITAGKYDDKGSCLEVIGLLRKKGLLPIFEGV